MSSQQLFRVLVIEDNPADVEVIQARLAQAGATSFQTWHANVLADGLQWIDSETIDVVLLDLSLPDSEGIQGCEAIRARNPTVPIVVLTGLDDEEVAVEALQRGAQDYLVKGQLDSNLLTRSIRYAIERQRIEVELQTAHDELEQRVEQRTRELSQANQELKVEITERQRAEDLARRQQTELAHLARLNMLGEMGSSLAHELNQPLTAIVAYARSCLRRLNSGRTDDAEIMRELEKLAAEAKRGGEIIKRLRRLVSKRELEFGVTNVNDAVQSVLSFVDYEARNRGFTMKTALDASIPEVRADKVQIEQVLLNLVHNGLDAMGDNDSESKVLSICTAKLESGDVEVRVVDRGSGAPSKQLQQLFEPFHTTKENGLGLGLSISRSIIETHSGKLILETNEGRGLTARFTLPIPREYTTRSFS